MPVSRQKALSAAWIRRNVDHAYIDEELWLLLNDDTYADKLKGYVISTKIIQQLHSIEMVAEPARRKGLKTFLSLLLAI